MKTVQELGNELVNTGEVKDEHGYARQITGYVKKEFGLTVKQVTVDDEKLLVIWG